MNNDVSPYWVLVMGVVVALLFSIWLQLNDIEDAINAPHSISVEGNTK